MPILPMNYVSASPAPSIASIVYSTTVPPPPPPQHFLTQQASESHIVQTYLIVGASRGIGLALVRALLAQNHQVIAVVRRPESASQLWQLTSSCSHPHQCIIKQCDVASPQSIDQFADEMRSFVISGGAIDHIILNAGILRYNEGIGAMNVDFHQLTAHLTTNCTGLIVTARKLLELNELDVVKQQRRQIYDSSRTIRSRNNLSAQEYVIGRQTIFISSDSGSMGDFREYEHGFAAYAASKAALNMMVRHMAAELKRFRIGSDLDERDAGTDKDTRYRDTSMNTDTYASTSTSTGTSTNTNINSSPNPSNLFVFTGIPTPSPDQNIYTQPSRRHHNHTTSDLPPRLKKPRIDKPPAAPALPPWQSKICVLAIHPGEVQTDMADLELPFEVDGVISADESAAGVLRVLRGKDESATGGFWRWDGREHCW